jgi:hypothetical protein
MRSPGCITIYLTVAWCFGYFCETCHYLSDRGMVFWLLL